MNIDEIIWHDGILAEIIFKNGEVHVLCNLLSLHNSRARERVHIACAGVTSVSCTIDMTALLDNARAGNISNARIEKVNSRVAAFKIFLADGYLDVKAAKVAVARLM